MLSCQNGHELCARALLEAKANVNATSNDGLTALIQAASVKGSHDIVLDLLKAGADQTKTFMECTALDLAKDPAVQELLRTAQPTKQ